MGRKTDGWSDIPSG